MATTKIQWATKVWNPVTGCSKISEACENCYAEKFAKRLQKNPNKKIADKYFYGFNPFTHPESLQEPYLWKKPQRVFACSMGDIFHENIPFSFIAKVMNVIKENSSHIFMILTKRPELMATFFNIYGGNIDLRKEYTNLWIGVTAENQQRADERIPILLQIPAAIRFVSVEPMLGYVDLENYLDEGGDTCPKEKLDWVICGGETGNKARPLFSDWVKRLCNQCYEYKIPFFFKQWGEWLQIYGKEYEKYPLHKLSFDVSNVTLHSLPVFARVGKKQAGNLLGGSEYKQFPTTNQ